MVAQSKLGLWVRGGGGPTHLLDFLGVGTAAGRGGPGFGGPPKSF